MRVNKIGRLCEQPPKHKGFNEIYPFTFPMYTKQLFLHQLQLKL